jgi:hypothetical protein
MRNINNKMNNNNIMSDINNNNNNNNNNNIKRHKPICVLCHIPLNKMGEGDGEEFLFRCSKCHKIYQLYYEVMAYESDFGSIYQEEEDSLELEGLEGSQSSPALVVLEKDEYNDNNNNNKPTTRSDIALPKYMQDSQTTKVIEYNETIEEEKE